LLETDCYTQAEHCCIGRDRSLSTELGWPTGRASPVGMPHAADDLASADEVKIYKDEGDEENRASENLSEDKIGLVTETEEVNRASKVQFFNRLRVLTCWAAGCPRTCAGHLNHA